MAQVDRTERSSVATARDALARLIIALASQAGSRGDHAGAVALLTSLADIASRADALDLLACVRAQQRRYDEAVALWTQALALKPTEDRYRHRAEAARAWGGRRFGYGRSVTIGVAVLLVTSTLGWRLWRLDHEARVVRPPGAELTSLTVPEIPDRGLPHAPPPSGTPPAMTLSFPGVTIRRGNGDLTFIPADGVFRQGVDISETGRRTIAAMAPYLATQALVTVVGHTDERTVLVGRQYRDNVGLGFLRAMAVAEELVSAGVSPDRLRLGSRGAASPPFPPASALGGRRNRTVTIEVRLPELGDSHP